MENLEQATVVAWRLLGVAGLPLLLFAEFLFSIVIFIFLVIVIGYKGKNEKLALRVYYAIAFIFAALSGPLVVIPISRAEATWQLAEKMAVFYLDQCEQSGTLQVWAAICTILGFLFAALGYLANKLRKIMQKMRKEHSAPTAPPPHAS